MDKSRLISNRKSDGIFLSSQIENEKEYVLEEQIMMKLYMASSLLPSRSHIENCQPPIHRPIALDLLMQAIHTQVFILFPFLT